MPSLAVGEFRKLAQMAEADGHLRQKLQQVLKLSKEKWDDARDHAMRAVVADNRMRIWYADKANMELGLLFICRLGNVDLDRPVGECGRGALNICSMALKGQPRSSPWQSTLRTELSWGEGWIHALLFLLVGECSVIQWLGTWTRLTRNSYLTWNGLGY